MAAFGFDLLGFRLRIEGDLPRREWDLLLGRAGRLPPPRSPDLTVRFSPGPLPAGKDGAPGGLGALRGHDFVLLPRQRLVHVSVPVRPTRSLRLRDDWTRAAAFALSLLAEIGPHPGGRAPSRFLLNLHASCVASPKGALVFCGYSTYGKSTISSRLLGACPLVDDDLVLVLCASPRGGAEKPGAHVVFSERYAARGFGRPFRGPCSWALPLAGIFWLRKSRRFELREMSSAEAAAGILSPVMSGVRPGTVRNRLRLLRVLLQAVPCRRLEFRKERGPLVRLLREHGLL